ncbi:xylose isomerase [Abditibacteriota bacterium]|nr:xylose isomerase [Abditibacteriota bacterium]
MVKFPLFSSTMSNYQPKSDDLFTFGLWTVGNTGRDPFGEPVREAIDPNESVRKLAELGAHGVNFHDNDLVPFGSSAAQQDSIVLQFKKTLEETGMKVPMATTNLFSQPVFKDGAFTSSDSKVRNYAIQKTMRAMDLGAEFGAHTYVFWGGREGAEVDAAKNPLDTLKWMREALNFLNSYQADQGYNYKLAIEPKPNEPRGDIYLATTGHALAFIETLDHPENVGVNPEFAHDTIAGLNFTHNIAQALDAKKLFHIDLNGQKPGRFDQDLRFGAEDLKGNFYLVKLLEDNSYSGPKHFDAHALRTSDREDVWAFAKGCMRTYLILKEKAAQWNADSEIQGLFRELNGTGDSLAAGGYSKDSAGQLHDLQLDAEVLAQRSLPYERLEQLTLEVLMGTR